ncbi:PQQ-binding-like beta-propeller repeat protein [Nocardia farcinica]|uniref:outer membrane protein assembly factor BamB family protein n=1 Tax=Nocardia farcinica TaxID=37329 RepID=UPI00311EDA86
MNRTRTGTWLLVGTAAGAVLGLAVTVQVLDWIAIFRETGGSCGTSRGISYGDCPRYWGTLFGTSLAALMVAVPVLIFALIRARRRGASAAVVAAVVAVYPGVLIFDALHGETLPVAWSAPADRAADTETAGFWHTGDTVVRATAAGLTAYDTATGAQRWTTTFPGRDVVCAMSRGADGVGLVATHAETAPCARVAAVDLATGGTLWELRETELADGADVLAVLDDAAILVGEKQIRAVGRGDGAPRWQYPLPERTCGSPRLLAGSHAVVLVHRCDTDTHELHALDPRTGNLAWQAGVPFEGARTVIPVSADPLVVHVAESGKRARSAFAAFDRTGRLTATIPTDDPELPISSIGGTAFAATPITRTVVTPTTLVAVARPAGGRGYRLVAHELATGARLWTGDLLDDDPDALALDGDRVLVCYDEARVLGLGAADLRSGADSHVGVALIRHVHSSFAVLTAPGRYLVVSADGRSPYHPVQAVAAGR